MSNTTATEADIEFDATNHSATKRKTRRKPKNEGSGPADGSPDSSRGADGLTERMRTFLACYVVAPSINRAIYLAKERCGVNITRSSPGAWKESNPNFAAAFEEAKKEAIELLETEARRRAVEGIRRLKFHKGEPIVDPATGQHYFEDEYSDSLLTLLLKSNFPEKYRERSDVNISGSIDLHNISDVELEERAARLGIDRQRFVLPGVEAEAN